MKNKIMYIFLIILGLTLPILGHNTVKTYFQKKYFEDNKKYVAYNKQIPKKEETTTTSSVTTTTKSTTTITTSTTISTTSITKKTSTTTTSAKTKKTSTTKKTTTNIINTINTTTSSTKIEENQEIQNKIEDDIQVENDKIIYDGLTLIGLTEKLNKNLKSTLSNTGHYFANYYLETGLDPYLAVAIVLQETGCKWTCSKLVRNCNNIGGMKGNPKCNGGSYKKYDTLEEGIYGYLNMLYKNYYSKGLTTPELINPKYATSTTWSINVNNYIDSIKKS